MQFLQDSPTTNDSRFLLRNSFPQTARIHVSSQLCSMTLLTLLHVTDKAYQDPFNNEAYVHAVTYLQRVNRV